LARHFHEGCNLKMYSYELTFKFTYKSQSDIVTCIVLVVIQEFLKLQEDSFIITTTTVENPLFTRNCEKSLDKELYELAVNKEMKISKTYFTDFTQSRRF